MLPRLRMSNPAQVRLQPMPTIMFRAPETAPRGVLRYLPSSLDEVEDVQMYAPGGFHPISLGDTLANGRYKILHKLGFGSSSTVWLARVEGSRPGSPQLVTLKVMSAFRSLATSPEILSEVNIPLRLRYKLQTRNDVFANNIHVIEDSFSQSGPNGTHICLVSQFLGPSVLSVTDNLGARSKLRLRGDFSRRVAHQIAKTVERMHSLGYVHGGQVAKRQM